MTEHREMAAGRWFNLTFAEQMANIGGEVERALNWRQKGRTENSQKAAVRALELMDLTLADARNLSRARELARGRELFVDYLFCENEHGSTPELWRKYYNAFALLARKNR